MSTQTIILSAVFFIIGVISGVIIAFLRSQKLRNRIVTLESELNAQNLIHESRIKDLEDARQKMSDTFASLSLNALKNNSEHFINLARENFQKLQNDSKSELDKRETSINNLLKPIKETLEKTEKKISEIEKERHEAFGSLSRQLEMMVDIHHKLQSETRQLTQALKRPEVRGRWGEMTLKRLAELAGMVEWCDFTEQDQVSDDENRRLRPDMIIRMPNGREIIVDAKTPLDAYLKSIEAETDEEREIELDRHLRKMKERVQELSKKSYWEQFSNSPDFVVMFIPGDQFLNAALERDHSLTESALAQRIVIATPTSLIALMRAIAFGWRQENIAANALEIRELGEQLHQRMGPFFQHLSKLGKSLNQSIDHYNSTIGSVEKQIFPSMRRFEELGIKSKTSLDNIDTVTKMTREPPE